MTYALEHNGKIIGIGYVKPEVLRRKAMSLIESVDDVVYIRSGRFQYDDPGYKYGYHGPPTKRFVVRETIGYVRFSKSRRQYMYHSFRNNSNHYLSKTGRYANAKEYHIDSPIDEVNKAFAEAKKLIKM